MPDAAQGAVFSPDGRSLAVAHAFGSHITLWDVLTQKAIGHFGEHDPSDYAVFSANKFVQFSPDGQLLAFLSSDLKSVVLRNLASREERDVVWPEGLIQSAAFTPQGNRLALGCSDGRVRLWDINSKGFADALEMNASWSLTFSPDGQYLAGSNADGQVVVWDSAAGKQAHCIQHATKGIRRVLLFSPRGRYLASAGNMDRGSVALDAEVLILDLSNGHVRIPDKLEPGVYCLAFSPDENLLASGGYHRVIRLWSTNTLELLATLKGHFGSVRGLAFSPDGETLASAALDRTVMLWDLAESAHTDPSKVITLDDGEIRAALSPQGDTLATADASLPKAPGHSEDQVVTLWDTSTLTPRSSAITARQAVRSLIILPQR